MIRNISYKIEVSPLIILHFPLLAPKKFLDAQIFNLRFSDPTEMTQIADKLRWLRHSKGLMQREVARIAGVSRSVYIDIECGVTQHLPECFLENLSRFYGVPPTDFLDEYNRFLYDGQTQRIIAYRRKLGMGRKPFCRYTGIPLSSLRGWEDGKKEVSRKSWEMYFKGRA